MTQKIEATLTVYLSSPTADEFIELQTSENRLRVRFGAIGHPCMVLHTSFSKPGHASEQYQRLLGKWHERGYTQCTPSVAIIEGSVADELFSNAPETHPLFKPFFSINGSDNYRGGVWRIALFRNGLHWHDHFDVESIAEFGLHAGLIVDGDVEVDGVFSQLTYTFPEIILVSGDVRAWSFGHKDSHMRVLGNLHVRNIVYGEYNDGSLRIDGDVYGRAFISSDHDMYAEGCCHSTVWNGESEEQEWERLSPELFEPEEDEEDRCFMIDGDAMRLFMHEGRDPFRPGAVSNSRPAPPSSSTVSPLMPSVESLQEELTVKPASSFMQQIQDYANAGDVEAMTCLIESWPNRDDDWRIALISRLSAPSTTPEQRKRLEALIKH
ncbi:hypothetical protein Z042_25315 [Chania multitudinisentens RB-25]|uniref:Uncharacterized protein n=1 Tax=Chania multitudinisentens RB-25 TaxID=1441930 RepID=A0A0D4ZYD9_9GAMM|nr:hypothetical protein [Chania multitudinisentens]AJW28881.1 hypothetical protein Z042_25315 [Chania multitudinisentens RB-25]